MITSTAVDDQMVAAHQDATARLAQITAPHAQPSGYHPAESTLASVLADSIVTGTTRLCEHVRDTPQVVLWSAGSTIVGCENCWRAAETEAGEHRACAQCADPTIPANHRRMLTVAGPAIIVSNLCADCAVHCRDAPLEDDLLLVVEANVLIAAAFRSVWWPPHV